jgi:hypothetical protein
MASGWWRNSNEENKMAVIAIQDLGDESIPLRRYVFDTITELSEKQIAKMICKIQYVDNYDTDDIENVMSSFGEDGNPPVVFSDDKQAATWLHNTEDVRYAFVLV